MTVIYPLLTLVSIGVFAWLGRRMALTRRRSPWVWGILAALLPPLLLILWRLRPLSPEEVEEDAAV